jgi:hypothetical protein
MAPTEEQLRKIRLLSDIKLYEQAVTFIQRSRSIPNSQISNINGLLNITKVGGYEDVLDFMEKKITRAWPEKSQYMKRFYTNLAQEFEKIKQLTELEFHVSTSKVPEKTAQEKEQKGNITQKSELDIVLLLMIREFIQHLAAENGYRRETQ